jgi:hypothetical protein
MISPNSQMWSIDKIVCEGWGEAGSYAYVDASNWTHDSLSFEISLHPDGHPVFYNVDVDFNSEQLMAYQADEIIREQLLDELSAKLDSWWEQVIESAKNLSPKFWSVSRGLPVADIQYARLANLYQIRASMAPLRVTQLISQDMQVPLSTAKERLRKAKEKGFLSSPGKGLNGQGEMTREAIKILEKEERNEE